MMKRIWALSFALVFAVGMAKAEAHPLDDALAGGFGELKGKVVESVQSGPHFWLRVDITRIGPGYWKDTIIVTYRTVPQREQRIPEKTIVGFKGWYRGKTSYQTVLGATLELPLVEACLLWDENDTLRFAPPKGCGW
jgi:hypothetical protein